MRRPNEREFLAEVLQGLPELQKQGLDERLLELAANPTTARAAAIQELLKELASRD